MSFFLLMGSQKAVDRDLTIPSELIGRGRRRLAERLHVGQRPRIALDLDQATVGAGAPGERGALDVAHETGDV
jgi:hypothetical protein